MSVGYEGYVDNDECGEALLSMRKRSESGQSSETLDQRTTRKKKKFLKKPRPSVKQKSQIFWQSQI
jgi:hypothetical protein